MLAVPRLLLLAGLIACMAGCSSFGKKDKPVEEPVKLSNITNPSVVPHKAWRASAGRLPKKDYYDLQLALEGDKVYAADGQGKVTAFDGKSGRVLWRSDTKRRLIAGPGVVEGSLILGTLDGDVLALDRKSGAPQWHVGLSSEVLGVPEGEGDIVVARGGDGRLVGLSLQDGQQLWTFDRSVPTLSLRGVSRPLMHDGRVFVGLDSGKVVALDLVSGKLLWETTVSHPGGRTEVERLVDLDADMMVEGDTLYAVSYGGQIAALNILTGEARWRHEVSSYSGLAMDAGHLYATDREGRVWAFDRETGATVWKQEGLKYRRLTRPGIQAGYVVVGDYQGYLHWLSTTDGRLSGRIRVSSTALSAGPEVMGGRLYELERSGGITAIDIGKR